MRDIVDKAAIQGTTQVNKSGSYQSQSASTGDITWGGTFKLEGKSTLLFQLKKLSSGPAGKTFYAVRIQIQWFKNAPIFDAIGAEGALNYGHKNTMNKGQVVQLEDDRRLAMYDGQVQAGEDIEGVVSRGVEVEDEVVARAAGYSEQGAASQRLEVTPRAASDRSSSSEGELVQGRILEEDKVFGPWRTQEVAKTPAGGN
ncbi:hypothetical protein LTR70_007743 [Exophiala xenobiotica]|uniref:Uncharacterized protein n=1 Tax=Lithohypha guttulata TaxID=1690604 RepID=A0ABR0K5K4_9EURO|nr:hypothetical protein LTR24_006698 [Lithohypha guttulata]KAK5313226.1 hypothetical protein LTR70_007743 [Exophiala xenobiotica]